MTTGPPRHRARPPRLGLAAVCTGLVGAVVATVPAGAQSPADTVLQLVGQKLVLAPEEPLTATLAVGGAIPEGAELAVTVYSRLRPERDGLHAVLDDGADLGGTVDYLTVPLVDVPRDAAGRLSLTVPTVRRSSADSDDTLRLNAAGLYPVTFDVRTEQDDPVASLLTFLQRTDDAAVVVPMSVALVTSVSSPPAGRADGTVTVDERARSDLAKLAEALAHNLTVPATVSLPPELLDRLATSATPEDQELVQNLASVLAGRQVLSRPYVTLDPSSSARSNLSSDYTRLLSQGEDTLRALLPGITPDRTLYLAPGGVDEQGLQLLRNLGTLNVVLPPVSADGPGDPTDAVDTTHSLQLTVSDGSVVRAEVPDWTVVQRIAAGGDPVLAAHYLATELIALQAEQPDQPGRGAVVLPPPGWAIDPVFLGTLADLLGQIPQLQPVNLSALFAATGAATTPDGTSPVTVPPPGPVGADRSDLAAVVAQRRLQVAQVSSMLPSSDAMPGELREVLDLSLAEDLPAAERDSYLRTVDSRLGQVTGSIIPMDRRQFTITSRRTTIPISVRTTWPEPLMVKVRLTSPKLSFPEGDQVITVTESSPPFRVPVEAKSNGTFQVTATLLTPQGDAPLGPPIAITVRSTALSGLGILVTIAGALALAAWWFQHLRSKRRKRLHTAAAGRHPASPVEQDHLPI
ncbi:MAG TPA: hypothetical protein VFP08_02595 [Acidimicrobiales bacterium]|nr:hypothetical protein [Acidimicrobiales bacterium]